MKNTLDLRDFMNGWWCMDTNEAMNEIKMLRKVLAYHADLYYNHDNPEIEDSEYDALVRRLEALEAEYPEMIDKDSITRHIGGKAGQLFTKINHQVRMESLQNAFSRQEIAAFIERIRKEVAEPLFVVEPKIDGLSVSLEYINGELTVGATRGDGNTGEDVTENLKTIASIPHHIKSGINKLIVRGEVFMPKHVYTRIVNEQENEGETPFKNPRNAAAGSLRQKDPSITAGRHLDIFIFNVQYSSHRFFSHKESLECLKELGLPVSPSYKLCLTSDDIYNEIDRIQAERQGFVFDIDGAVLKLDSLSDRQELGSTSKFPKWSIAYKYPPEIKTGAGC